MRFCNICFLNAILRISYISDLDMGFRKKGKGKEISLQAWRGPAGSRRLRLPDFKTIGT
jgi:hypothetical protein